jgi:protein-disulfide isomerase/uncharacterized membrane protein
VNHVAPASPDVAGGECVRRQERACGSLSVLAREGELRKTTYPMRQHAKRLLPVFVLAVLGLGVSVAIETIHRRLAADTNYVSFCNVSDSVNCDVVLASRYAVLAGASVSTWAILFYVVVLALATGLARAAGARQRETLGTVILLSTVWSLLFSAYMAVIAFFVLHTVCLMCSALYLTNVGMFAAAWWLRIGLHTIGRRQALERAGQNRLVFLGSVGAVVALIVIGSWEALGRGGQLSTAADIERQRPEFYHWFFAQPVVQVPLDASHSRGDAAAPVTIVEFSDFECTHCAAFHQSLEDVLRRADQNVRVIFRHFPLDSACNPHVASRLHPQACLAAVASECAAEQGKFWQYHNVLFDNQQQLGREFLIAYATRLGMDSGRFAACLASETVQAQVERDTKAAAELGIDSTPTWFINGREIKGALEPERLVDALTLARVGR